VPNQTASKVDLSARSRKIVEEIAKQRRAEYRVVVRALMMLAMADGVGNNALARNHQMDRVVVRKWRNRRLDLTAKLKNAEASEIRDEHLRDLILTGLSDLPRSGTPPTFTAEQIVQIVAVSCEEPSNSGRPISHSRASRVGRRSRQTQNRRKHLGVKRRAFFLIRSISNQIGLNTGSTRRSETQKNLARRSKRCAISTNRPRNCTRKAFIS
jgi:putative transposase